MTDSPAFSLRRYSAADHDGVMLVHRAGLDQVGRDGRRDPFDVDLDHIEDRYLAHGDFLVGESEGRIAAIGGLRMLRGQVGELRRMRIHPDFHGRGYDQILLDELTERAQAAGARRLVLDVDERRVPAHRLYERNGFVAQGTLLVGRTPSIVFEKALEPFTSNPEALLGELVRAAELTGAAMIWRAGLDVSDPVVVGSDIHAQPLSVDSLFPTASLSKLAVALGVLRLVDRGALDLEAPIRRILPSAVFSDGVTLRGLLSHTAGIPELPEVQQGSWTEIGQSCLATPAEREPGLRVGYSNQGYGILGLAMQQVTGLSFGAALRSLVLDPLELEAYVPEELPREPVQGWRFRVLPAGGVFMTIRAALRLIDSIGHPPMGFLDSKLIRAVTQDQTGGLGGGMGPRLQWVQCSWGLGPEIRGDRYSPWIPVSASADSYGHAGASGCVAWTDPRADASWAILTVPPTDRAAAIRWHLQSRPNLADVGEALLRSIRSQASSN